MWPSRSSARRGNTTDVASAGAGYVSNAIRRACGGDQCDGFVAARSLQALRGFSDQFEVGMLAGVEVGVDDPELAHQIDVALQRLKVHQPVGIPVEVVPREDPALEPRRRLLEEAGKDLNRLGPVGGVEI